MCGNGVEAGEEILREKKKRIEKEKAKRSTRMTPTTTVRRSMTRSRTTPFSPADLSSSSFFTIILAGDLYASRSGDSASYSPFRAGFNDYLAIKCKFAEERVHNEYIVRAVYTSGARFRSQIRGSNSEPPRVLCMFAGL